jgi:hypothetical protein
MVVAVLVAVGLIAGGWFAATQFTSPQQRAAAATAPKETPVTAPVQTGDLVDKLTLSGTISPTSSFTAALTAPTGTGRSVLTTVNSAVGSTVAIGTMVATVDGQPVFALQSPFPFYRDLGAGDTGLDVRSLQQNLVSMGLLSSADGNFGSQTVAAVTSLFDKAGFAPPTRAASTTGTSSSGASSSGASQSAAGSSDAAAPAQVVYFPMAAAMTVASLPEVVATAPQVGADVGSSTFGFTATTFAVYATPPASLPDGLAAGTKVTLTGAGLQNATGTVRGMVPAPGTSSSQSGSSSGGTTDSGTSGSGTDSNGVIGSPAAGSGAAQTDIRIDVDDASLLKPQISGQSVTVSAMVKTVAMHALIVPTIAVAEQDPTHGTVLVVSGSGTVTRVPVTIIGTISGSAALQPGGRLKAGQKVRVG